MMAMPLKPTTADGAPIDKPKAIYTLGDLSPFMLRVMDAVGLSHAPLIAGSVDGILALKIALQRPHRVDKLVLISMGGWEKEVAFPASKVNLLIELICKMMTN